LNNQIALSMEIGASSAVQICLLMMPILVGFSAIVLPSLPSNHAQHHEWIELN